jgi:hypothetical protein
LYCILLQGILTPSHIEGEEDNEIGPEQNIPPSIKEDQANLFDAAYRANPLDKVTGGADPSETLVEETNRGRVKGELDFSSHGNR